jgi:glycosyltransferase involved in cell wall biosynthesis
VPRLYGTAIARHLVRRSFTTVRLPEAVDIFHLTAPLPVRIKNAGATILTLHDLIPLRLPYTTLDNRREILRRFQTAAQQADLILTVSESTKRDIVALLKIPPERIRVTYQTTDIQPLRPSERNDLGRVLHRFGLSADGYCLFVGAIEPKKNVGRLIEAFLESDIALPLVIVGRKAWLWDREIGRFMDVADTRIARRLKFLNYVSRNELRYLYAGAQFLAFPSLYEGFGLPLLEGMRFGLPVLTSNTSALPEIGGEAALYVDPYDVRDIRDKLERLAGEADLRRLMSEAALKQAEKFSFERYRNALAEATRQLT